MAAASPHDAPATTAVGAAPPRFRALAVRVGLAFALAFLASFLLLYRGRLLYDNDSYYHLAVARQIAAHGLPRDLPWARFSIMNHGFGDKELLFHVLLAPFAAIGGGGAAEDPLAGGRLALAFLDALLAAACAYLALQAVGGWGVVLPFVLFYSSPELAWRLVRLRPELLSLLILALALWAVARRRHRWLAVLAALYALSYTAFHALLALCFLIFVFSGVIRRSWDWRLPLYATLGAGLGLVLHPQLPKNLEVWVVQSIEYFRLRGELDVGTEIQAHTTDVVLLVNCAWLLGLGALVWAARRGGPAPPPAEGAPRHEAETAARAADAFGVAAVVFGLLYLLMSRFATYFFPFATLWALFELRRRRGERLAPLDLAWGKRRLDLRVALALALLAGLPAAARETSTYRRRTDPGPGAIRSADRAALSRALPPGSRVAAPWRSTALYVFYAPQALYLDLLDPVFMAVRYPQAYAAQRDLFAGAEPDAPLATAVQLDSELIAFPLVGEERRLGERLASDPRIAVLHRGINAVYRVLPGANRAFILDWRAASAAGRPAAGAIYPRLPAGAGGVVEGFVDGRRLGAREECLDLVHTEEVAAPVRRTYELAPYGPTSLALDGQPLAAIGAGLDAVIGRGLLIPVALAPGRHAFAVHTCPGGGGEAATRIGFYLLDRTAATAAHGR